MFTKEVMTPHEAAMIVQQLALSARASVMDQISQKPFSVQIETVDLSSARTQANAKKIAGQFRSMYIQSASDTLANIQVVFGSNDSMQSAFTMRQNDAVSMDLPVSEAYIYWTAQAGKTLTFVTFTNAKFESGSQISVAGGGVAISTGTTVVGPTQVVLPAATVTIIIPASTSGRKQVTLQNKTAADLYIGGSTLGAIGSANEGLKIGNDGFVVWTNTAALYGFSTAGGNVSYIEEV